ncbi:hypothetical protein EVB91_193 [Rhizobium phage RHph_I1_18]|nr:hypothetical protein EVB91_193 [Rhizobium phage RHph_I1_18]
MAPEYYMLFEWRKLSELAKSKPDPKQFKWDLDKFASSYKRLSNEEQGEFHHLVAQYSK